MYMFFLNKISCVKYQLYHGKIGRIEKKTVICGTEKHVITLNHHRSTCPRSVQKSFKEIWKKLKITIFWFFYFLYPYIFVATYDGFFFNTPYFAMIKLILDT